jgi:hypothetical protein
MRVMIQDMAQATMKVLILTLFLPAEDLVAVVAVRQ